MADVMWLRKCLAECVSTDPTRYILAVIHHDPEGPLVATNGWSLFMAQAAEVKLGERATPGADYHAKALLNGEIWVRPRGEGAHPFPDWRKVIPKDQPKAIFRAKFPAWISAAKRRCYRVRECSIMGGTSPHLRLDGRAPEALTTVDLRHLRPYALTEAPVFVAVRGPEEPLVFAPDLGGVMEPLKSKWVGLIMPLRAGSCTQEPTLTAIPVPAAGK